LLSPRFLLKLLSGTEEFGGETMEKDTRRSFVTQTVTKMAALTAFATGAPALMAKQSPIPGAAPAAGAPPQAGANRHVVDGVYYFSGTGANDGYPKEDHVTVTDPFEKHVTRTMDALKKTLEHAGCTMDSIVHLTVFLCLPLADTIPMPAGKARFDAHKAQYDALNKIYGTYFSPGKSPSRACMALEWIPGDSLIEIVGSALVINPVAPPA
jgi:enamine deaminase RidA (YjgF/YER057c/UK114 family)